MAEFDVSVRNRHFQRNQSGMREVNRKIHSHTHTYVCTNQQDAILFVVTRQDVYDHMKKREF